MRYTAKPSFLKLLHRLPVKRQHIVKDTLKQIANFFEAGEHPKGLGLKKLRGDFWEVRVDIKDRIIFRLHRDVVEFVAIGGHNEIKKFLKGL